jgi:hypothetical protein
LTVHITALIIYSVGTAGISHLKNHDLADTLFEIFGRVGNLKFFGVALRNKDSRMKKLR